MNGVSATGLKQEEPHLQDEPNRLTKTREELEFQVEELKSQIQLMQRIFEATRRGPTFHYDVADLPSRAAYAELDEGLFSDGEGEGYVDRQKGCIYAKGTRLDGGGLKDCFRAVCVNTKSGEKEAVAWVETKSQIRTDFLKKVADGYKLFESLKHKNIQHPYTVFLDYNRQGELVRVIALEKLGDTTLETIRLPQDKVVSVVRQMGEAVCYLHANLIIHRDIKPGNYLVLYEEGEIRVLLTDPDFAKRLPNANTRVKKHNGSIWYASPECYVHGCVGLKGDVWALGLATHEVVMRSEANKNDAKEFLPKFVCKVLNCIELVEGRVPSWLAPVVGKALCATNPSLDFQNCSLSGAIRSCLVTKYDNEKEEAIDSQRSTSKEFLALIPKE